MKYLFKKERIEIKIDRFLIIMVFLRLFSGLLEIFAAFLMYYFRKIETAIRINAFLGIIGPLVLIIISFIGLAGISSDINSKKIILIASGIILILLGTK